MAALYSLRLLDAKLSQIEGGQGLEETLRLTEEKENIMTSKNHKIDAVMK